MVAVASIERSGLAGDHTYISDGVPKRGGLAIALQCGCPGHWSHWWDGHRELFEPLDRGTDPGGRSCETIVDFGFRPLFWSLFIRVKRTFRLFRTRGC